MQLTELPNILTKNLKDLEFIASLLETQLSVYRLGISQGPSGLKVVDFKLLYSWQPKV
jgi:hypothetical protein